MNYPAPIINYKVSVIVPALNEENNISITLQNIISAFDKIKCWGEIVIINDGSTDKTEAVVQNFMSTVPFIRIISHESPKGIGASFWKGVEVSQGDFVVLIPGDAEVDSYEILRYLPLMNHVDIVIPFFFNRNVRSWTRRMISKIYKGIINLTFGLLLNYMNGTVMYRKSVLLELNLKSQGFFYQTELLIKAIKKEYLYAEVPCSLKSRLGGKSKALTIKSLLKVISAYLATIYYVYAHQRELKSLRTDSVTASRYKELL
jgi:glycosyltransferase involved in cell wall biosynthesis